MSQSDNKQKTEGAKKAARGGDRRRNGATTGDGVPTLKWSPYGSNLATFKKAFAAHVEGLHGFDAIFLDTYERGVWEKPKWADYEPQRPLAPVILGGEETKGETEDGDDLRTEPENTTADDFEMEFAKQAYRDAFREYSKQIHRQKATEYKIYGLITEKLSAESLDRVKSHEKWTEIHKSRDALKLWILLRDTHKVGAESSTKSMSKLKIRMAFFDMKQGQHESLVGYKERFILAQERCEESEGTTFEPADVASQFYHGLNEARYGGFKKHLENSYAVDNATEPADLQEMYDRVAKYSIANHRATRSYGAGTVFATTSEKDKKSSDDKKNDGDKKDSKKKEKKEIVCWACDKPGHPKRLCPENNDDVKYACVSYVSAVSEGEPPANDDEDDVRYVYVSQAYTAAVESKRFGKGDVLLDSQSDTHLVASNMLTNVRRAKKGVYVRGIAPEAVYMPMVGDLEGIGECVTSDTLEVSVLCWAKVARLYKIFYEQCYSIVVYLPGRELRFYETNDMHVGDMSDWIVDGWTMVTTAEDNEKKFTKDEVARAKRAQELITNAGHVSEKEAVELVRDGNVRGMPVTVKDVRRAFDIYGKPTEFVRGRMTKKKHSRAEIDEAIRVPGRREHCDIYSDVMYVRPQTGILVTLATPLGLVMVNAVKNQSANELGGALLAQVKTLRSRGFDVQVAHVDPQSSLRALQGQFESFQLEVGGAGDHLELVDAKIRRLKEMMRSVIAGLPYKLPTRLVVELANYVASRHNLKKSSSNGSRESPRVAFTGVVPNYVKELAISFGEYVECYNPKAKSNNVESERSEPCIALYPVGNAKGSWIFMNIKTRETVRRTHWTKMVTTSLVIDVMNRWAAEEGPRANRVRAGAAGEDIRDDVHREELVVTQDDLQPHHRVQVLDDHDTGSDGSGEPENNVVQDLVSEVNDDNSEILVVEESGVACDNVEQLTVTCDDNELNVTMDDRQTVTVVDDGVQGPTNSDTEKCGADDDQVDECSDLPELIEDSDSEDEDEAEVNQVPQVPRRSARVAAGAHRAVKYSLHTSVVKGLKEHGAPAYKAVVDELLQMLRDKKALHPVRRADLSNRQVKRIIRSLMFLKPKFDGLGRFEKIKARLVANGKQQDRSLYPDTSSPTAMMQSIFMCLVIAAVGRRKAATMDIGGAYLNAVMTGEEVIMELDKMLTSILAKVAPEVKPYVDEKGRLLCKLDRAVYGCVQSAKLWYCTLTDYMKGMGFVENEIDKCVLNRKDKNGKECTVVLYVDDLLVLAEDEALIDELYAQLRDRFEGVSMSKDADLSYLGMHIRLEEGEVVVSMQAYLEALLNECEITGVASTPGTAGLFTVGDGDPLSKQDAKKFHTVVAKLLYLAARVRVDILLEVIYLCTRVQAPTSVDQQKLDRVLKYLNGTRDQKLVLKPEDLRVRAYIDAAFACHPNGKSHTGLVLTVGGATVLCKSQKQKIVTKDSTEAELVGLHDMLTHVNQCCDFLTGQGVQTEAPVVFQDNTSTITLVTKDGGKYRSKYMLVRRMGVREQVDRGDVTIEYMPTKSMLADALTKPLQGGLFRHMISKITGWIKDITGVR